MKWPVRVTSAFVALWSTAYLYGQCPDTARLSPIAILDNGTDSARLEVSPGGGASSVSLRIPAGTPVMVQGTSACSGAQTIPLYDDGTHGDQIARDGVFTLESLRWHAGAPSTCGTGVVTRATPSLRALHPGDITFVRNGIASMIPSTQFALWVLPVSEFGIAEPVTRISSEVQVSAHVVNVADNQETVNKLLSGEQGASIQDLARKVYSAVPDVYDFLNFTSTTQRLCTGSKSMGLHVMVKQTWTGTGSLPFDTTASYGSAGRLLGINFIEQQSSDSFPLFAHETMHQWAAYLPASLGLTGAGGHWSERTDIAGAVGGGNWSPNGDGTYSASAPATLPRGRLSPLELYLMGLASPAEVPPVLMTETQPLSFGQYGSRVMGPFRQVSITQIQQAAGSRFPGPESAQRSFRTAFVVTSPGRLLTSTEMTAFDRISRLFTGSLRPRAGNPALTFAEISGGRAALETSTLPCTFSSSPIELNAPASGNAGTIFVNASASNCRWTVSGSPGWMTVSGGGSGSGSFAYTITPNSGTLARSGSIVINGLVTSQRLPVLQAGSAPHALPVDCRPSDSACLESLVTRSQMAVFAVRAILGTDNFSYSPAAYFDDVPAGHPHFAWVQKLRELGITSGCGTRQFCPGSPVSRGEMAVFLIRARLGISAGQEFPFSSGPYFRDVPMSHQFFPYIQKMRESGITLGCSATEYCPNAPATRWQMGTFVVRAFGVTRSIE